MAKHTQRTLRFETRTDRDTGARVTRLTPPDVTCHRNYFYQKCFTQDGSKLIFGAEFGPGPHWNYHLLDLASGAATQLTCAGSRSGDRGRAGSRGRRSGRVGGRDGAVRQREGAEHDESE